MALISLHPTQIDRLGEKGAAGKAVADLARDPNRFLATIQIGITLAGFMASAAAAVSLAQPLVPILLVFGGAAETVAIVVVTILLSFLTLVLGELAPKRLALQRAEGWALHVGRPLNWLAVLTRPAVWLLSLSTNLVVRLFGGDPAETGDEVNLEELREMVIANRSVSRSHQEVLVGAFEVAERTLREVLVPRTDVEVLDSDMTVVDGIETLLASGHSRAPAAPQGVLDDAEGVAHLRDLVAADSSDRIGGHIRETVVFPESVEVLTALRRMQEAHVQLALVIDEFGGVDGIISVEDLVEELVGEIYDESDRDVLSVDRDADGGIVVSGRFPVHDLVDVGIEVPEGEYTTVSGLVLDTLGEVPSKPGFSIHVGDWNVTTISLRGRSIGSVRFTPTRDRSDETD
ncbi:MAG: DUF21 domain-containing protein [Acidimicrobiia bacterium]|nr:DUF21 domain-containing protein [Acidimicrobiia bacterium]